MIVIYWMPILRSRPDLEKRIRERFRLGTYKSVNGETPIYGKLSDEDLDLLKQVELKGYIHIRLKNNQKIT